jgi:hypothetical protein
MTKEEELTHLETHAIHLRKILELTNERIAELTNPADIFAKEKAAFKAGKRIAWRVDGEYDWEITPRPSWDISFEYKIVEDDIYYTGHYVVPVIDSTVKTKYTKCALTGKITAEVV